MTMKAGGNGCVSSSDKSTSRLPKTTAKTVLRTGPATLPKAPGPRSA